MHVIIGFLGSVVTILWLLHRLAEMGIDLGGLNPWAWRRRRNFRQKYEANPIFAIDSPLEATALLATAVAKAEGDMTGAEKQAVLKAFEPEFSLSERDASALLTSSVHLLGNGHDLRTAMDKVLKPSIDQFSQVQAESALKLLTRIADADGDRSAGQNQLITQVESAFARKLAPIKKWD